MIKKILFIGGPGNISENAINLLLENAENRIAVFTLPESSCRGLSDKVIFYWGNRDNTKKLAQTINDFKPDVIADFVCFFAGVINSKVKSREASVRSRRWHNPDAPRLCIQYRQNDWKYNWLRQYHREKLHLRA